MRNNTVIVLEESSAHGYGRRNADVLFEPLLELPNLRPFWIVDLVEHVGFAERNDRN